MAELVKGIDLSGARIACDISALIGQTSNQTVARSTGGYTITESGNGTTFSVVASNRIDTYDITASGVDLPSDFGYIEDVNEDAVSLEYITRTANAKKYFVSEDFQRIQFDEEALNAELAKVVVNQRNGMHSMYFSITSEGHPSIYWQDDDQIYHGFILYGDGHFVYREIENGQIIASINPFAGIYSVDNALSSTSENPVQNKVINSALSNKVDKVSGKGLSTNDFTTALKTALQALSATSGNPYSVWAKDSTGAPAWKGAIAVQGAIPSTDLNEVMNIGLYWIGNVTCTNAPSTSASDYNNQYLIVVATTATPKLQIIAKANNLYIRHYTGSPASWGSWRRFTAAVATTSAAGLMSASDKTNLNSAAENAQNAIDATNQIAYYMRSITDFDKSMTVPNTAVGTSHSAGDTFEAVFDFSSTINWGQYAYVGVGKIYFNGNLAVSGYDWDYSTSKLHVYGIAVKSFSGVVSCQCTIQAIPMWAGHA